MNPATIHQVTTKLKHSTDGEVLSSCHEWNKRDRVTTALLLTHLAEIANRRLYLDKTASMFAYCTEILKLDPGCAWLRLQVAGCCRKYPQILEEIATMNLSLSVAALLAPRLRPENAVELIALVRNKTKREADELLANRNPKPACAPSMRSYDISVAAMTPPERSTQGEALGLDLDLTPPETKRSKIEILGLGRYDVKFTLNAEQKSKLERFAELMGISVHGETLAALLDKALDIALKARDPQQKRTRKQTDNVAPSAPGSRYISMALKKQVLERAEYRCQHASADAVRCSQRRKLQIDHIHPLSWGGETASDNLQVLCVSHHRMKTETQQGRWITNKFA